MARGLVFVFAVAVITVALIVAYAFWRAPASDTLKAPSSTVAASGVAPTSPSASSSVARSASPTPKGQYENATYGYRLILPEPYRYSEILSRETPTTQPIAQQAFTARTVAGEEALKDQRCETACAIWNYVAVVMIWTNADGKTPKEWYSATSYARDATFEDVTVDGRPAVRVSHGARFPVELIIKDGERMYDLGYDIVPAYSAEFAPPPGATQEKLEQIVSSFHFIR